MMDGGEILQFQASRRMVTEMKELKHLTGAMLVKMSAAQYAFYLQATTPMEISLKMTIGEAVQKIILGDDEHCELAGDTGKVLFTFDKIHHGTKPITFQGWHYTKPNEYGMFFIEHKFVSEASYQFYGKTLLQLVAYYNWSLQCKQLKSAYFTNRNFVLDLEEIRRKPDLKILLMAIVTDSQRLNTLVTGPTHVWFKELAKQVDEFYNSKMEALFTFYKDRNWTRIREWDRNHEDKEKELINNAVHLFETEMYPYP